MFFKKNDNHKFMPLLAEIEYRPVNPLGRVSFWIVVAIILFFTTWLFTAKTDVVISSRGEIKSGGGERFILSKSSCIIKKALCKPGDYVVKGQPLLIITNPSTETAEAFIRESQNDNPEMKLLVKDLNSIKGLKEPKTITSPCSGFLAKIYGKQPGVIIFTGQKLVSVIASEPGISIESYVSNTDIGKIKQGMTVKIKLDAFSFQNHGMLKGKIIHITQSDRMQPSQRYSVVSVLNKNDDLKQSELRNKLKAGMTVTAEIKTGYRSLISFFIYPLIKYMDEGMSL